MNRAKTETRFAGFAGKRRTAAVRLAAGLLCLALLLGLAGCANGVVSGDGDGMDIVATNFPLYDFARVVTGGRGQVRLLLPPGAESHSYEPSPQDIIRIQECDLFLYIGGENDDWIDSILESMGVDAPQTLVLIDCVTVLEEAEAPGMTVAGHAHEEEAHEPEPDEHIWTSLRNAGEMVDAICAKLSALDPDGADGYRENAAAYRGELGALDARFAQMIGSAARNSVVVGDRFPFLYFAADYGLEWHAAFPGCSAQSEPSAATVAFLTDLIEQQGIPVVLYIEFSNHQVADAVAEAAGVGTAMWHSCHNLSRAELDAGATYLSLMEQNYQILAEALNG